MNGLGRSPRRVAVFVWYGGAVALTVKGTVLLAVAVGLGVGIPATVGVGLIGIAIGAARGKWFFGPVCRRNLARIAALPRPRFWHAYRPGFWAALVVMILAGSFFSHWAKGHAVALMSVAVLELGIAAALWVGGAPFWRPPANPP